MIMFLLGMIVPVIINLTCFHTVTSYGGPHNTIFLNRWTVRKGTKFCWEKRDKS